MESRMMKRRTFLAGAIAAVGVPFSLKPKKSPPRWRNHATTYSQIAKEDLVEQMRELLRRAKFVRPETTHPYKFIGTEEDVGRLARFMEEYDPIEGARC